jgi:hypothetical protein
MSAYRDQSPYSDNPSTTSSSTIRPRNRRLLSTEQELLGSKSESASRAGSPIPRPRLSAVDRSRSVGGPPELSNGTGGGKGRGRCAQRETESPTQAFGRGLFEGGWSTSWSALQGLASSVLGDLNGDDMPARKGKGRSASAGPRKTPSIWGPEGGLPRQRDDVGKGSLASREAAVRARKMADVLEAGEDVGGVDSTGRYKRRTSIDKTPGHEDDDGDVLVYVHHVQPNDTLAGVVLKYNCPIAPFKKANRLWSNDGIQFKKVVLLPVDACGVRGRPCDPPTKDNAGVDLLAPTPNTEDSPDVPIANGDPWGNPHPNESSRDAPKEEEEQPWTHVRWVLLDSSPNSAPTEIARLPRRTLGYFPPRRRKSTISRSVTSTPRTSIEGAGRSLSSYDAGSANSTPSRRLSSNAGRRPSILGNTPGSYFPSNPSTATNSRRGSVGADAARLGWMRGPGGVGSLTGKNVRIGPGQDVLNTWAHKHLPGLAIDDLPSTSITGTEAPGYGFGDELGRIEESPFGSRSGSMSASGSDGLGLENAAAAIEGWVRRLAVKGPGTPRGNQGSGNTAGSLATADGDLIELLDGQGSDDGRGFEVDMPRPFQLLGGSSGREDLEAAVRGRGRAVSGARSKAGKSE